MTLQDVLVDTLQNIRADPSRVATLYEQLAQAQFLSLVRAGTQNDLALMQFLTYPTPDKVSELPLFTRKEFVLPLDVPEAVPVVIPGNALWLRLLDIIKTGVCEVAVDPGQPHGIRLTREMVLGMVNDYISPKVIQTNAQDTN
jgi:hypothetical protein